MSNDGKNPARISRPTRFFVYIFVSLILVAGLVGLLREGIATRFFALGQDNVESAFINGFILVILALGILFILAELFNLGRQVTWLQQLQDQARDNSGVVDVALLPAMPNQMLAPVYALFADSANSGSLSTQSSQAVIDAISGRIEERRELSRWLIQTLIILGLIGTFWGLFGTISQIGSVIGSLQSASSGNASAAEGFGNLIKNLQPVLASMGVAFSSSLLGLAGSLLLGFLELQAGSAQNRFVEELEDWLYSITKMRSAFAHLGEGGDFDHSAASQQTLAMLESVASSMDRLRSSIVRSEDDRAVTNRNIVALGERIRDLAERHAVEQTHLAMLSQNAANFGPLMERTTHQVELMQQKAQIDHQLLNQVQAMASNDQAVQQLAVLNQQLEAVSSGLQTLTDQQRQLSDRDAQDLSARLDHMGAVFAQAAQQASEMSAERIERAIQAASQET